MLAKKRFLCCMVVTFITRIFELLHKLILYVCKEEMFVLCGIHIYHTHIRCVGTLTMGVLYPLYLIFYIKSYPISLSYRILFNYNLYIYYRIYLHKAYNIFCF